jgi:hypothetical protein
MRDAVERLAEAGRKAVFALNRRCAELGITQVGQRLRLYDALVKPVLTYAAEVWAGSPHTEKVELVQREFFRSLLGVRRSTSTAIVLSELGRYPLALFCWAQATKFYNRLLDLDANRLLRKAWWGQLDLLESGAKCWAARLRGWLLEHRAGGGYCFPQRRADVRAVDETAKQRVRAELAADTDSSSTVLRYLSLRGATYGPQAYLGMQHCQLRQSLARFRCGNHTLEVEVRKRGTGIPVQARLCNLCCYGAVEDEQHLLLVCPLYTSIREKFAARLGLSATCNMRDVMTMPHSETVARFIVECLNHRTETMENLPNNS